MLTIGAVAAHFGSDVARGLEKVAGIVAAARAAGVELLVLPGATLGGYLDDLLHPDPAFAPPALAEDGPEIAALAAMAGPMVVCAGYAEAGATTRAGGGTAAPVHNAAVCVSGDGVLGRHRKVHLPAGEAQVFTPGTSFGAFDTPVGRLGLLVDYDKTFPEAARALALDGASVLACLSAWPASVTDRASRLSHDRQTRLFDLYDSARAAENQVVWVSSNLTGRAGRLRFLGRAKVVGPGGDVLAATSEKGGLAVARIAVAEEVARSRRTLHHLAELSASAYANDAVAGTEGAATCASPS